MNTSWKSLSGVHKKICQLAKMVLLVDRRATVFGPRKIALLAGIPGKCVYITCTLFILRRTVSTFRHVCRHLTARHGKIHVMAKLLAAHYHLWAPFVTRGIVYGVLIHHLLCSFPLWDQGSY